MTVILFFAGLVGLLLGGEALVRGAVAIAHRFNVPPLVIGLTIVGFGTSAPELLVAVQAALAGVPDIAVGNVIGSNIANTLLIMGLAAAVSPVALSFVSVKRDFAIMIGATLLVWLMFMNGVLGRWEGGILLATLGIYLCACFCTTCDDGDADKDPGYPTWMAALLIVAGLVGLMLGARALVDSATEIARAMGVSEAVIGLTIVAIGTSLPEMATALMAAYRGQGAIAVGNVIGSNILNLLAILGTTAVITPIPIAARFLGVDMAVAMAAGLALVAISYLHNRISRRTGFASLGIYAAYMFWLGA